MANTPVIAGIDLGGTNMQIGLVNASDAIVARRKDRTKPDKGADAVLDRIVEGVRRVCDDAGIGVRGLGGVGIGAPGAIDLASGVVLRAPNLGWENIALRDELSRRLDGARVFVDNDVTVAVYGEVRAGACRGMTDVLGVWVGTGVGGGFVLAGEVYRGVRGTAGEIGQTTINPDLPRSERILEHHASRSAVARIIRERIERGSPSVINTIVKGDLDAIRASAIGEAYEAGDRLVRDVVHHAASILGVAIANHLSVLSLDAVVLGGGLSEALGEAYAKRVRRAIVEHVFPQEIGESLRVLVTELKADAGILGAAILARESFDLSAAS